MTLPSEFLSYTRGMMGDRLFERFLTGMSAPSVVSVRLHPQKNREDTRERLPLERAVPWCEDGYYLTERPQFTSDPLLHAGAYYVQEASSMFIDQVVRQHITAPALMLDLCAAPGGKSTALRAALPHGSLLVSNEPVRQRANILMENMQKWGHPDVIVTHATTSEFRRTGILFDAILTDVPCSGEGMFRKDAGAIAEWSVQNVLHCQHLQREIVADAWTCLRPGGVLIYSTCTFNTKENEENIAWMMAELGAELIATDIQEDWGITGSLLPTLSAPVHRFIPGVSRGEGLFMAVVRKRGENPGMLQESPRKKEHRNKQKTSLSQKGGKSLPVEDWLEDKDSFVLKEQGQVIRGIPRRWQPVYDRLSGLHVLHAGVEVATLRGRDLVPCHALALSTSLRRGVFEEYAMSAEEAIRYLRREALTLPPAVNRGFVLMTYENLPLGFVKNLGSRANNLYPQEWRILSGRIK